MDYDFAVSTLYIFENSSRVILFSSREGVCWERGVRKSKRGQHQRGQHQSL